MATGTDGYSVAFEEIAKSQDAYPVDFDQAWQWIGYSAKGNAKRKLEADFVEAVDYLFINADKNSGDTGHPSDRILLTIDCFKQFCMMAGTDRGKQVRLHYLEIERKFKAAQAALATTPHHDSLARALQCELSGIRDRLDSVEAKVDTVVDGTARIGAWAAQAFATYPRRSDTAPPDRLPLRATGSISGMGTMGTL